jgi:hypothetical protein
MALTNYRADIEKLENSKVKTNNKKNSYLAVIIKKII